MLEITVPEQHYEFFDEDLEQFFYIDLDHDVVLRLEHSLKALRKWENKTHKPFIKDEEKTKEEIIEYIRCMTLNEEKIPPEAYQLIPNEELIRIKEYIDDPMTATWFKKNKNGMMGTSREVITAEIIYYWMIALNIPREYEEWHLNQLMTLIKVVSIKNNPKKEKVNKRDAARERAALNAQRRAKYNSKG